VNYPENQPGDPRGRPDNLPPLSTPLQYRKMRAHASSPFGRTCDQGKLLCPLLLGQIAVGATWYVGLFLASCVCSRLSATCLATCPYRVCIAGTRLSPPGFAPELTRSWSTCEYRYIYDVSVPILTQPSKNGKAELYNGCSYPLLFDGISEKRLQHLKQRFELFAI